MKVRKGVRRGLVATVMALAVAFMSAGCEFPHFDDVRTNVHDYQNSDVNNIYKHRPQDYPTCSDAQGNPSYCDDGG